MPDEFCTEDSQSLSMYPASSALAPEYFRRTLCRSLRSRRLGIEEDSTHGQYRRIKGEYIHKVRVADFPSKWIVGHMPFMRGIHGFFNVHSILI